MPLSDLIQKEDGRMRLRTAIAEECEPYEVLPRGHAYAIDEDTGLVYEVSPTGLWRAVFAEEGD